MTMDTYQADLLRGSLRELFADATAGAGPDARERLRELRWDEVAAEHPVTAITLLFTEKGRALSRAALLDDAVLPVLTADLPGGADAVCFPYPGCGSRPSSTAPATTGILLRGPAPHERLVIPVAGPDGVALTVAPASDFTVTPLPSLDHDAAWYAVAGATPTARYGGHAWAAAVTTAHRALAAEIIGVTERALEHTSTRRQFNAPIAAFQAVRHRLADAHVAVAAARALLDAAFAGGSAVAALAAKARPATRTRRRATARYRCVGPWGPRSSIRCIST
jgi:hypothetical protein